MQVGPKSVHIVSTDFDYASQPEFDRMGYIFEEKGYTASEVYVLTNTNTKGIDEDIEEAALSGIIEKLEDVTTADQEEDITVVEVDYYDFEDALVTVYDIIYREEEKGNNVFVNISGGTKPLAIAVSFASALAGIEHCPFYIVKEYEMTEEDGITSPGIEGITQPDLLNIQDIIPSDQKKRDLLLFLWESEQDAIGVTDLLVEMGVVASSPAEGSDDRGNTIQSYHRKAQGLIEDNLIEKNDKKCNLTSTGGLVAQIIEVENGSREE